MKNTRKNVTNTKQWNLKNSIKSKRWSVWRDGYSSWGVKRWLLTREKTILLIIWWRICRRRVYEGTYRICEWSCLSCKSRKVLCCRHLTTRWRCCSKRLVTKTVLFTSGVRSTICWKTSLASWGECWRRSSSPRNDVFAVTFLNQLFCLNNLLIWCELVIILYLRLVW